MSYGNGKEIWVDPMREWPPDWEKEERPPREDRFYGVESPEEELAGAPLLSRIEELAASLLVKEPAGPIDTEFLQAFFSSEEFREKVNQAVERIKEGMILGEVGFEAWRTKDGFELYDLKPIGQYGVDSQVTPDLMLDNLKAGKINFFSLHFHPGHTEIILPSGAHTPGRPPDVVMLDNLSGDLFATEVTQDVHQVVTGYRIAPIEVIGGVNLDSGETRLLFIQEKESQLKGEMRLIQLVFLNMALLDVEDQAVGIGLLREVGYRVALIKWKGKFSKANLAELNPFSFIPSRVPWKERFAVTFSNQIEKFLETSTGRQKTKEELELIGARQEEEEKRRALRAAGPKEKFVPLGLVGKEMLEWVENLISLGEITGEEGERLKSIFEGLIDPKLVTVEKQTIINVVGDVTGDVLRARGINPDFLPVQERAEIARIISEHLVRRPHELKDKSR